MTDEELKLKRQQEAALAASMQKPTGSSNQALPSVSSEDRGGFQKAKTFKEGSGQVTEGVTRAAGGALTFGTSEIPIGGQSLGSRVGGAARNVDNKVQDFFRKMDPTSVSMADNSGVNNAQTSVSEFGNRAQQLTNNLMNNPVQSQQVQVRNTSDATMTGMQKPIVADVLRGTNQQVSSGGNASFESMTPAQIAELERMQAAGLDRSDIEFRQKQINLANSLESSASGQGPSVAQMQLDRANEQAIKNQMAMVASARGGNPVLAQRQAAMNVANLQQENAAKSAEMRLAEAIQARGQLGSVLDSARGQDIGVSSSQAGLQQEAARVNKQAEDSRALTQAGLAQEASKINTTTGADLSKFNEGQILTRDMFNSEQDFKAAQLDQASKLDAQKATALNNINTDQFNAKAKDEMERFKTDASLKADVANQAAALQAQGLTLDAIAKSMGLEAQSLNAVLESEGKKFAANQAAISETKKGLGGLVQGAASAIASMSDKRSKKDIKPSGKSMDDFLDKISSYTYEYKNTKLPGTAEGKRFGIIAQDLEKSDVGKSIVRTDKESGMKMIDNQQAIGVLLSAVAELNKKMKEKK